MRPTRSGWSVVLLWIALGCRGPESFHVRKDVQLPSVVTGDADVTPATGVAGTTGTAASGGPAGIGGVPQASDGGQTYDASGEAASTCTPSCAGTACENDGCDGTCGTCDGGQTYDVSGEAASTCTPSCAGKACGSDGCGGTCGTCDEGQRCDASGQCGAAGPCAGICSNPVTLVYDQPGATGNFPAVSSPFCYVMLGAMGANCNGGAINVNGQALWCNGSNLHMPAALDGGYCFSSSNGLPGGYLSLF